MRITKDLLPEERQQISSLQTAHCWILQSAVVQMLFAHPNPHEWTVQNVGVVCLILDAAKQSHFIRYYDVEVPLLLWNQEVYEHFQYEMPFPYFHVFDGECYKVGLNFANEVDALQFHQSICQLENLPIKSLTLLPPLANAMEKDSSNATPTPGGGKASPENRLSTSCSDLADSTCGFVDKNGRTKEKSLFLRRLKAMKVWKTNHLDLEIGLPYNFKHVQHYGPDCVFIAGQEEQNNTIKSPDSNPTPRCDQMVCSICSIETVSVAFQCGHVVCSCCSSCLFCPICQDKIVTHITLQL